MPVSDPRLHSDLAAMGAIIEAITGLSAEHDGNGQPESRVVLPMDGWDELEYLAADDTEEPTDLATVLSLARDGADVMCEGEEEGEEWVFYVSGVTMDELLPLVQGAIPESWTASLTDDDQITVTRR